MSSAVLGIGILGYSRMSTHNQSALAHVKETSNIMRIESKIKRYFSTRAQCVDIFNSYDWDDFNDYGVSLNDTDSSDKANLEKIYNENDFFIKELSLTALNQSPSPLVALPTGGVYKATLEMLMTIEKTNKRQKTLRNPQVKIATEANPYIFIFHINKDKTLRDCYLRSSPSVALAYSSCNSSGGVMVVDECLFPEFTGNINTISEDPTEAPVKRSLSEILCELDRKAVLIEAQGLDAYISEADGVTVLIDSQPGKLAVTKFCPIPQGLDPNNSSIDYLPELP